MLPIVSRRVTALRALRGWTQEDLESKSDVSLSTIQRLEAGRSEGSAETLRALAAAFNVEVSQLTTGLTLMEIEDLVEMSTCPHCGSMLVERSFVEHQYGDGEVESFACGHVRGMQRRPCPTSDEFPQFADYELHYHVESGGTYWCYALGKTEAARQVHLQSGPGDTPDEAKAWLEWSYRKARNDPDAGDFPSIGQFSRVALEADTSEADDTWKRVLLTLGLAENKQ